VSARTRGRGLSQCGQGRRGKFFTIFGGRLLWTALRHFVIPLYSEEWFYAEAKLQMKRRPTVYILECLSYRTCSRIAWGFNQAKCWRCWRNV